MQVFTGDKKTHDITKGKRRSAQRLFFYGHRKIFYCFFPKELLHFAEGAGYHLSRAPPSTWSERLRPFCLVSPTGGGRASLIGRQRPGQGCDATSRSSPRIYFRGPSFLGRWKNCGRRQRNGGCCTEKPESELELVPGRKRERREVIREREKERRVGGGRRALCSCRAAGCPASACPGIPRQP